MLAARVVSAGTTLLLLVFLGHTGGASALGVAGLGLAAGSLLNALCDAGTTSLLIREGARDPRRLGPLFVTMAVWRLVVVPVLILLLWTIVSVWLEADAPAVVALAAGLAIQGFAEIPRAVFVARQQILTSSVHSVIENVAWITAIIAVLLAGGTLEVAFTAGAAVFSTSMVTGLGLVVASGIRLTLPDGANLRTWARQLAPFAGFTIVGVAYSRIDTLLVGILMPSGAVAAAGAYFSAVRLTGAVEYVAEAVARASYPRIAKAFVSGPRDVARELQPLARFLVVAAMPIPVGMLIAGPWLMTYMFGSAVAPYAWLAIPLGAIVPLRFLAHLFGMALTATDAQGRRLLAAGVALVLIVTIDIALIPLIGIAGAVAGSLVAVAWVFGAYVIPITRISGTMDIPSVAVRSAVIAAVSGLAALLIQPFVGMPMTILVLGSVYVLGAISAGQLRYPSSSLVTARDRRE